MIENRLTKERSEKKNSNGVGNWHKTQSLIKPQSQ